MFNVIFGPEWGRVVRALGREDREIPLKSRESLRKEALRVIPKVKAAVLRLPTHGRKHTGLRARVSAGVGIKPEPYGARITTSMPEPDEAIIPRGLDRTIGWIHPVYGNRNVWVRQRGYSWFRETISDNRDEFGNGLQNVLQDAAEDIADAGGTPRPGVNLPG